MNPVAVAARRDGVTSSSRNRAAPAMTKNGEVIRRAIPCQMGTPCARAKTHS
jgi:hypothetical protein